jgi:hypothetical protein
MDIGCSPLIVGIFISSIFNYKNTSVISAKRDSIEEKGHH